MTIANDLNRMGYDLMRRRAHAAEAVARQALQLPPLDGETAAEFAARIRAYAERSHPDLIIRMEHSRVEVLPLAENCGCDPDGDGYDDDHCESDEGGEYLCARGHLGWICDTCAQPEEAEDGPSWRPDRFEWPCPTVARLDATP